MFGLLDELFDFNHNGKMDSLERAAEFATFMTIMDEEDIDEMEDDDLYEDDMDDLF